MIDTYESTTRLSQDQTLF